MNERDLQQKQLILYDGEFMLSICNIKQTENVVKWPKSL